MLEFLRTKHKIFVKSKTGHLEKYFQYWMAHSKQVWYLNIEAETDRTIPVMLPAILTLFFKLKLAASLTFCRLTITKVLLCINYLWQFLLVFLPETAPQQGEAHLSWYAKYMGSRPTLLDDLDLAKAFDEHEEDAWGTQLYLFWWEITSS